jgi:H+-transporting ATPase
LAATFTLAAALGARTLAQKGVLLTRLSALHEAATIDVLCCDKTGTLTLNELSVGAIRPVKSGYEEADVLGFAALASSAEGDDPIDSAIRKTQRSCKTSSHAPPAAMTFKPFDPELKMAETVVRFASSRARPRQSALLRQSRSKLPPSWTHSTAPDIERSQSPPDLLVHWN